MSYVNFEIKIQGDSDGYVTFECPFCESQFKLRADECQDEEDVYMELYCPYCGLVNNRDTFYSKEVIEQVEAIAHNYMVEQLNNTFGKMANNINKSKFIKMDWKPLKKVNTKELMDKDTVEEVFECSTCGKHEKILYCVGVSKAFCAYCGEDL